MLATRWEPFAGMNRLQNEMNRLFDQWNTGTPRYAQSVFPPLNLWEDGDSYLVEAELPGLALDDLEIYVTGGNQLSIKGQRTHAEADNGTWHRRERGFGPFSRLVDLPGEVDADNVSAEFSDGVLTITLPKGEKAKPRKIEIKAN